MACGGLKALSPLIENHPELVPLLSPHETLPFKDAYPRLFHHLLCRHCDFFIDGCDFTDPDYTDPALPCGGYVAADALLQRHPSREDLVLDAFTPKGLTVTLDSRCVLKRLEAPYLYHIGRDELYELDEKGLAFFQQCDGTHPLSELSADMPFLDFCFQEGLLHLGERRRPWTAPLRPSPVPSLRYLEIQLTNRCNLRCRHCYLGRAGTDDLALTRLLPLLTEFEAMQGLRVLFSGGEPLLYPELEALHAALARFALRKVLLTNGTLIRRDNRHCWRGFDEIQFSLDGLETGHEALRGAGTFPTTVEGIRAARAEGVPVSIATMVHPANMAEFDALAGFVADLDAVEWSIDVPCQTGRFSTHPELAVSPEQGAPFLRYGFGGSYHGAEEPYACGYHLCTVTPRGEVLKCGFFDNAPLGKVSQGLETAWKRAKHLPLSELACSDCRHVTKCKGGCRFRAGSTLGKDPVMCALYGVA